MELLARTVELASLPVTEDPEEVEFHGDVMWFGADGSVKMAHEACGEVCVPPPMVWITFLMEGHPFLETD